MCFQGEFRKVFGDLHLENVEILTGHKKWVIKGWGEYINFKTFFGILSAT